MTDIPAWLIHRIEAIEARLDAIEAPETVPVMIIDGACCREHAEITCKGCLFEHKPRECALASELSQSVFGGSCCQRDVVYVDADK